ncbi:MAG: ribosomal small subunit protein bTHX [Bacteroidetes bacterium RIFCSPLOWO2_12_FULL_31_6]|nr:MAG: ribosomal small subunit protein bTHX [Bacteroidetes bacterium RIFCSPLOWO2_12_FULL_31_6]
MGKGDKKSRKGKIFQGSYGITRPRKAKKHSATKKEVKVEAVTETVVSEKKATTKKAKAPKKEEAAKTEE